MLLAVLLPAAPGAAATAPAAAALPNALLPVVGRGLVASELPLRWIHISGASFATGRDPAPARQFLEGLVETNWPPLSIRWEHNSTGGASVDVVDADDFLAHWLPRAQRNCITLPRLETAARVWVCVGFTTISNPTSGVSGPRAAGIIQLSYDQLSADVGPGGASEAKAESFKADCSRPRSVFASSFGRAILAHPTPLQLMLDDQCCRVVDFPHQSHHRLYRVSAGRIQPVALLA